MILVDLGANWFWIIAINLPCAVCALPQGGNLPWQFLRSAWCSQLHPTRRWLRRCLQHGWVVASWSYSPTSDQHLDITFENLCSSKWFQTTNKWYKPNIKRFAHYDLGGACDWFASSVAATNHHLLGEEDLFGGDLNTQVAAGNHDAIAGLHDLIESAHSGQAMTMAQFLSPWFSKHFGVSHCDGNANIWKEKKKIIMLWRSIVSPVFLSVSW